MAEAKHLNELVKGVDSWNLWRTKHPHIRPNLRDLDFTDEKAFIGTPIWSEEEKRIYLMRANLDGVDFWRCNLARVYFTGASMRHASFRGASLSRTNFNDANITGANFTFARFDENNVSNIKYSRRQMRGRWQGIRGAETIFGDAVFRRDVLDQDVIDTLWAKSRYSLRRGIPLILWSLTDYGRSWASVVIFAILAILLFGFVYDWSESRQILTYGEEIGIRNPFTPFFASAMGFATLGLNDLVTPNTFVAQIIMILNAVSGFVTLGLLLSVLSNIFARRS